MRIGLNSLREIIGIIYSGLYGNNTCDYFYGIFARLLWNFYLTTGNNRLAKGCLRGPRLLAEYFFHSSYGNILSELNTWDYCSEVNQVKFTKDFSKRETYTPEK